MVLMQNVLCCVVALEVFSLPITNISFYWRIRPLTEEEMYKFIPTNFKEKKKCIHSLANKRRQHSSHNKRTVEEASEKRID